MTRFSANLLSEGDRARLDAMWTLACGRLRRFAAPMQESMTDLGFLVSPCSTRYHLHQAGGLAIHSTHVAEGLVRLSAIAGYGQGTCAFIGLVHDLCKAGSYDGPNPDGTWEYARKGPTSSQHGELSRRLVANSVDDLSPAEGDAIEWHMNRYDWRLGGRKRDITAGDALRTLEDIDKARKNSLVRMTHLADIYATRMVEDAGGFFSLADEANDEAVSIMSVIRRAPYRAEAAISDVLAAGGDWNTGIVADLSVAAEALRRASDALLDLGKLSAEEAREAPRDVIGRISSWDSAWRDAIGLVPAWARDGDVGHVISALGRSRLDTGSRHALGHSVMEAVVDVRDGCKLLATQSDVCEFAELVRAAVLFEPGFCRM